MNRCDSGTDSIVWMIEDFNAHIFVQLIIKAPEVYSGAFLSEEVTMKRKINDKMLDTLGMFRAIAYALMFFSRFTPAIAAGFLKYDPKDIIIAISGFIYGPAAALAVSVVVAFLEFVTVSTTGWIGMIMNILASSVFACTASLKVGS